MRKKLFFILYYSKQADGSASVKKNLCQNYTSEHIQCAFVFAADVVECVEDIG